MLEKQLEKTKQSLYTKYNRKMLRLLNNCSSALMPWAKILRKGRIYFINFKKNILL